MASVTQDQQALTTTTDGPTPIITTPAEYTAAMQRWAGRFHVMAPFVNITGLAVDHGILAVQALIDADTRKEGANEVYDGLPFLDKEKGEVALAKRGLRKIAECAGISVTTDRTDPRTIPHYWEVKARAVYKGVDGAPVQREASAEWDLRDGSPRLKGFTARQIEEARKHGLRNAETRAINAAIRECGCGLKQKYTKAELAKPFLMLRVAYQPDRSDPEVRRILTQAHVAGTMALFQGARPALAAAPIDDEPTTEPRVVGSSTTAAAPAAAAADDAPPCEGAVRVMEVKEVKRGQAKSGPWTLWKVVDSHGVEYSTLDDEVATAAMQARDARPTPWLELITETKGEYTNLVELRPAGQQPSLLPRAEDL